MSKNEIIKDYTTQDLTIIWKPKTCIHAGECVKRLPNVYNPNEKPWIKPEKASIDELKSQIDACPSGALSYRLKDQESDKSLQAIKVDIIENGPMLVHGEVTVTKPDGEIEIKHKSTAFCRCGASENKPYCDGAHRKTNFIG